MNPQVCPFKQMFTIHLVWMPFHSIDIFICLHKHVTKHISLAHKWGAQRSQEELDACLHSSIQEFILLFTSKHKVEQENGNFTL